MNKATIFCRYTENALSNSLHMRIYAHRPETNSSSTQILQRQIGQKISFPEVDTRHEAIRVVQRSHCLHHAMARKMKRVTSKNCRKI